MLLWYSNFRGVRLPSPPATLPLAPARPARNFQSDSRRLSPPRTAHVPNLREARGPAHCPAPTGREAPRGTCSVRKSEASCPEKGKRVGCVAARRGDLWRVGEKHLRVSVNVRMCRVWGEAGRGGVGKSPD